MLIDLPVKGIKLDQMFCLKMSNHKYRSIAESMITLTETLGMSVMAEGIESEELKQQVMALGCTIGQGYYLHSPQSKAALTGTLSNVISLPFSYQNETAKRCG